MYKYIPTKIEFYPPFYLHNNHTDPLVHVKLINYVELYRTLLSGDCAYRVCIWGDNDYGWEQDFKNKKDYKKALNLFNSLTEIESTQQLESLGFIRA